VYVTFLKAFLKHSDISCFEKLIPLTSIFHPGGPRKGYMSLTEGRGGIYLMKVQNMSVISETRHEVV